MIVISRKLMHPKFPSRERTYHEIYHRDCGHFGALFMVVPRGLTSGWDCAASGAVWPAHIGPPPSASCPCRNNESRAKEAGTRNALMLHSARLVFRYQVNGQDYGTETVQFGRAIGSGDSSNEAVSVLRCPAGTAEIQRP